MSEKIKMYFCSSCGPFIRVYKEYWTSESEGPYKVDLIQHMNHLAVVVESIEIISKPDGQKIEYNYCAHCRSMIGSEIPLQWNDQHEMLMEKNMIIKIEDDCEPSDR